MSQVEKSGRIRLDDGRVLPPEYRQFVRGYAVTSYASQGKTVDHVLFSDSSIRAATNAQQWYVTISRERRSVKIPTFGSQRFPPVMHSPFRLGGMSRLPGDDCRSNRMRSNDFRCRSEVQNCRKTAGSFPEGSFRPTKKEALEAS